MKKGTRVATQVRRKENEKKKITKKNIFIETKSNITDACYNNINVIIRSLLREKTKK